MNFTYKNIIRLTMLAFMHTGLTACGMMGDDVPVTGGNTALYDSPVPKTEKQKVGKPYQIKGIWYKPEINNRYDEIGIASWYGPGFHGRSTANGEIFDENKVSAAHKTLPLPSYVEVTNLDNGKQLYIRVNDRGPFADDRIIDLSKRAAEILGSRASGLARVRVRMAQPPKNITLLSPDGQKIVGKGRYTPSKPYQVASQLPNVPNNTKATSQPFYNQKPVSIPVTQTPTYPPSLGADFTPTPIAEYMNEANTNNNVNSGLQNYAVRVGMFGNPDNIAKLERDLAPYGIVTVKSVQRNGTALSEVTLVGYHSQQEANDVVNQLNNMGIHNTLVVSQ